jgi:hypothetical protein
MVAQEAADLSRIGYVRWDLPASAPFRQAFFVSNQAAWRILGASTNDKG